MTSILALLAWSLVLPLAISSPLLGLQDVDVHVGDAKQYKFYDMPTPVAGPCDLCTGSDGALWGQDQFVNKLFRIDPETGEVEEFVVPFTLPVTNTSLPGVAGRAALACAIRPGADGNIYASNGDRNQMVQVKLPERTLKVFTPPGAGPAGDLQPFNDFTTGPNGIFFSQTTANLVSYFEFATETFSQYNVPGSPLGMGMGTDGLVYIAEFLGGKIARLNPETGAVQEFDLPLSLLNPAVVRVEQDGYVYFTAFIGDGIGRINMETGAIDAFPFPKPLALPAENTQDCQGRVWFSTASQTTMNYLEPSTGKFTTIKQPKTLLVSPISVPFQFEIATHYGPGNAIWFTQALSNRVGRYQLEGAVGKNCNMIYNGGYKQ